MGQLLQHVLVLTEEQRSSSWSFHTGKILNKKLNSTVYILLLLDTNDHISLHIVLLFEVNYHEGSKKENVTSFSTSSRS